MTLCLTAKSKLRESHRGFSMGLFESDAIARQFADAGGAPQVTLYGPHTTAEGLTTNTWPYAPRTS